MSFDPGALLASLLVSSVGLGVFLYGKKQQRAPQLVAGIVLMVYSYFVGSVLWTIVIGASVLAALWAIVRMGY
jgi:branched-subunit amino acid transport protein